MLERADGVRVTRSHVTSSFAYFVCVFASRVGISARCTRPPRSSTRTPRLSRLAASNVTNTMSRLTTAQIIELGDYLKPDFDPSSLTVSQLLGVFGYHNVMYPAPYTKSKLVQLFNDQIKSKATQLKKERLSRQNSQASDDGIMDGLTGRPLNESRKVRSLRMH